MAEQNLHDMTVSELRDRASDLDIAGRSSMKKDELIEAIENFSQQPADVPDPTQEAQQQRQPQGRPEAQHVGGPAAPAAQPQQPQTAATNDPARAEAQQQDTVPRSEYERVVAENNQLRQQQQAPDSQQRQ